MHRAAENATGDLGDAAGADLNLHRGRIGGA